MVGFVRAWISLAVTCSNILLLVGTRAVRAFMLEMMHGGVLDAMEGV